jgi:hypothetical protein
MNYIDIRGSVQLRKEASDHQQKKSEREKDASDNQ